MPLLQMTSSTHTDMPHAPGLDMVWNEAPPLFIPQGDLVFLSVNVTADNTFYNSTNDFLQM